MGFFWCWTVTATRLIEHTKLLIGLPGKENFMHSLHSGFKASDVERMRVMSNIFLRVICVNYGWHPFRAGKFTYIYLIGDLQALTDCDGELFIWV